MTKYPKPWEQSKAWKTKAEFFTWLRSGLRKSVWQFYPPKLEYKNEQCGKPPEGYTGRAKSGALCALTGEWVGKSKLEVDHLVGNASLREWEDVLPFILHLCCEKENMQLVDRDAHRIKSYAERMGISFELAVATKKAIRMEKDKTILAFLQEQAIIPDKNAKARRQQVINILMSEEK